MTAQFLAGPLGVGSRPVTAIYTSRLVRAAATAAPLAEELGVPAEIEPALLDVNVGRWEGLSVPEVLHRDAEIYGSWMTDPASFTYPGGESLRSVHDRSAGLLARLATAAAAPAAAGCDLVLFTHRVNAKLLVAAAIGVGPEAFWRIQIDNASVTVLHYNGRGYVLTLLNATDHLR